MTDQPLGPPPVEGLSDVAWARVERGVFASLDGAGTVTAAISARQIKQTPSRHGWLWLALPIAAAACLAVMFASRGGGGTAASGSESDPARVVSGTSPSAVSFGDAHITMDAETALEMLRDGNRQTVLLERGAAWFEIAPRGERPAFEVHAGDAIVRVTGARFRVALTGERAQVVVDHGSAEVRYHGRAVTVRDRETWSSDAP